MSEIAVPVRRVTTRVRRISGVMVVCFAIVAVLAVMAVLGPLVAPHDADQQDLALGLSGPSEAHLLGTDALGRDVLSRVIAGARSAVVGPLLVAVGSMLIGDVLGLLAGYRGGKVDALVMRWVDMMYALPGLLVAIVVVGAVGGGYWMAVALLIALTAPFDTRVVRGATLEQAPRPYVEAAQALGVSDRRIMLLHIWPNVAATAIANTFLVFATALVSLAGLSFLGIGIDPGQADWGLMLAENRTLLFDNPAAAVAPGLMIIVAATAMNLIGDWLYERLSGGGAE